jgi:hypothetical protein
MPHGFPDSVTQPTAFAYLNSYYPYSQRITVQLNNRSVAVPTAGLFLHPDGTNYYSAQFYTGATVSSFSHPDAFNVGGTTTASLTIRAFAGATDALYSVTTVNSLHPSNNTAYNAVLNSYYFTFVVSQSTNTVRDLCRAALPSASVPFVAEIKLEGTDGRTFTSRSFPITCFIPVIRSEQF